MTGGRFGGGHRDLGLWGRGRHFQGGCICRYIYICIYIYILSLFLLLSLVLLFSILIINIIIGMFIVIIKLIKYGL